MVGVRRTPRREFGECVAHAGYEQAIAHGLGIGGSL